LNCPRDKLPMTAFVPGGTCRSENSKRMWLTRHALVF
jgi:hypothetical protein